MRYTDLMNIIKLDNNLYQIVKSEEKLLRSDLLTGEVFLVDTESCYSEEICAQLDFILKNSKDFAIYDYELAFNCLVYDLGWVLEKEELTNEQQDKHFNNILQIFKSKTKEDILNALNDMGF